MEGGGSIRSGTRRRPPIFIVDGDESRAGIVPYYMFIARDTGAQAYFNVPLVRAQKLYSEAIRSTSGLCRTARGPSMSCTPGKVEVVGVQEVQGTEAFVLRFLQCAPASESTS